MKPINPPELEELPLSYHWKGCSNGEILGVGFSVYQKPIAMTSAIKPSPKKTKGSPFSLEVKRLILASTGQATPLFVPDRELNVSITYWIRGKHRKKIWKAHY